MVASIAANLYFNILADWKANMARKSRNPNFDQALEILRTNGFDVQPFPGAAGGFLVSKHGAGAVLVPAENAGKVEGNGAVAFAERPGALVRGEVARLLDRGYQKFIKTSQFELPASALQLQAIHLFSEELSQLTGAISLYNESLGTTSDVYQYDRLKGREKVRPALQRPWDPAAGH
ncbi:MAG: hypothetical protein ABSE46_22030 [Terracidiphilus sp.]